MRFSPPRGAPSRAPAQGRVADDGLGIHPALAKKYKKLSTPAGGTPTSGEGPDDGGLRSDAVRDERAVVGTPPPGVEESQPPEMDLEEGQSPTIELSPSLVNEGAGETNEPMAPLKERGVKTRPLRKGAPGDDEESQDGEAAAPPEPEKDLPSIPGYRFLGTVGKGAMGRVYRAISEKTGEPVAVKILAPELAARADFIARFEREAAALKAVDHPGVVSIVDRGSHGEHHYLAMPFVEGESLRRVLGKGALQPIRALGFARQIAQALGAAHAKKVIHRDLKPENILVQRVAGASGAEATEKLVLVDFGLAGMGEDDPHPNLTKSRMTMGTVNYMAPEQRTDAKRVGPPADVYAAGVILYELLTGDLPLGRFKMPTARPGLAHLPKKVDECVGRALDRDPEQRYPTCLEMDEELAVIERELEAQVSRDTVVGRVARSDPSELSGAPTEVASGEPGALREEGVPTSPEDAPSTGARSAVRGGKHPRAGGPAGSAGPQWVTAPPWVKRPLIIWGSVALLAGAALGVWTAPDRAEDGNGAEVLGFPALSAMGGQWQPETAGWTASPAGLSWIRPAVDDGAAGRVMLNTRDPSLAEGAGTAQVTLPVAGGELGEDELAASWAGVVLRRGDWAVGFGVRGDRTCVTFVGLPPTAVKTKKCAVPATWPAAVHLACSARGGKPTCQGHIDQGPDLTIAGPEGELGPEPWDFGLVCAGSRCLFEGAGVK